MIWGLVGTCITMYKKKLYMKNTPTASYYCSLLSCPYNQSFIIQLLSNYINDSVYIHAWLHVLFLQKGVIVSFNQTQGNKVTVIFYNVDIESCKFQSMVSNKKRFQTEYGEEDAPEKKNNKPGKEW